ncbi:hypothetical protein GLOIN_2v1766892 [Rhizophagus irregularis DAOM 181602=DAOM 197198]|nr:hypothetical protein GLOIN_2v1766892 [Rhizophagus irregularis DAOM 181602=DAOM 197198]
MSSQDPLGTFATAFASPSQSPSQSQSQPQWSQQYLSQSSQLLLPYVRHSNSIHIPLNVFRHGNILHTPCTHTPRHNNSLHTLVTTTVSIPLVTTTASIPSYSSQHLQHPSTQLLSDEEIDNLLATLFLQIEDIMSRAVNPVYVRQSIAERFAMTLPEHLHDQIEQMIHRGKRSSEERSRTSSSSTPIMTTPTLTRTDSMDTLEENSSYNSK